MEYFAGANTKNGFVSIFNERFKDIGRLYILKGSSGCGKSTFMRKAMMRAREFGIPYDVIYCSADSDSVDGVVFKTLGVAIADGTAPHTLEVRYPCVRESIINLGEFWSESKLLPKKREIVELTDKKSMHYANAYKCLSAIGKLRDIKHNLISNAYNRDKMDKTVLRLADKLLKGKGETEKIFASAFTSDGLKSANAFGYVNTVYRINGLLSQMFMSAFALSASELGISCVISLCPTDATRIDAVYIKESGDLVTDSGSPIYQSFLKEKVITTARFVDKAAISNSKAKLRAIDKIARELEYEAQKELSLAKKAHAEIEKIYIPAMDFALLDEYTEKWLTKVIRAE